MKPDDAPGPDETLDVLMAIIHREATRLERSKRALSPRQLEVVGKLATACAKIEAALRSPVAGANRLSDEQLQANIERLQKAKAQRDAAS